MGPSSDFVPPASLDNERRKGERSWVPDVKALHNTSQNDTTDSTYETGQLEALVADISGLDLRILRYARLVQDSASKVLTVSSPHLEGIFEATAQLLKILDWFQRRGEQKPPISNLLNYSDRGLTFGVLAVHQRLLHAYGTVYTLVKRRVQEASWSTMEHVAQGSNWIGPQPPVYGTRTAIVEQQRATPTGGPTAHGKGALYVSMAQHVMVLQLLSHMLSRLDRALGLSRGSSARIPSFSSENSNSGDSSIFHNWSPSVGFDFVTDSAATSQPNVALLNGSGDSGQKLGSGGLLGEERETVDSTLCMESRLRQQHDALQGDIESLKSHIERSREL
ncbi:hypothetical protein F5Y10DRAFT_267049 [Nemania abortiva]|nr:hypothetical protein F5Y10DRAFT_267049 [Nemania abortiva]